jgi:hypothetical protein
MYNFHGGIFDDLGGDSGGALIHNQNAFTIGANLRQ